MADSQCDQLTFRNFNLCPHCLRRGKDALLNRLHESMPMISRSDGETYHLLLADVPRPYPAEKGRGREDGVSLCFWYSSIRSGPETSTTIVLIPARSLESKCVFRRVEIVADTLAVELRRSGYLQALYDFRSRPTRAANQRTA